MCKITWSHIFNKYKFQSIWISKVFPFLFPFNISNACQIQGKHCKMLVFWNFQMDREVHWKDYLIPGSCDVFKFHVCNAEVILHQFVFFFAKKILKQRIMNKVWGTFLDTVWDRNRYLGACFRTVQTVIQWYKESAMLCSFEQCWTTAQQVVSFWLKGCSVNKSCQFRHFWKCIVTHTTLRQLLSVSHGLGITAEILITIPFSVF